jgi:hypothetical protein
MLSQAMPSKAMPSKAMLSKCLLGAAVLAAMLQFPPAAAATWPAGLPVYDHIVIVLEENKDYEEIISKPDAAFINELAANGALFTQMFGEEHNSEGNYFWLFSGSNQGVGFKDKIPKQKFTTSNLGRRLIDKELSFKGYAEDLPSIGSVVEVAPPYARKHVPWISFENVPNGTTIEASSNLRFADFPTDFSKLPTVAFVVPNLLNDMHDGSDLSVQVKTGDNWLRDHLQDYYRWARDNNSLLIVTFDESNHGVPQATDPRSNDPVVKNRIATVFAGAGVKPGAYPEGVGINHVSILRTIEAMYGLQKSGSQQPNAEAAGISDDFIITDIFAR